MPLPLPTSISLTPLTLYNFLQVITAIGGGKIDLYGTGPSRRWTKLASDCNPGDNTLTLEGSNLGWNPRDLIMVTSSSWNQWQTEFAEIELVSTTSTTTKLTLNQSLIYFHQSKVITVPGARHPIDLSAEVALISSNIQVTATDGPVTFQPQLYSGEMFGSTFIVVGTSSARLSNVAFAYGGQAGIAPTLLFRDLLPIKIDRPFESSVNPSMVANCSFVFNADVAVQTIGGVSSSPVRISDNVFYFSYDKSTISIGNNGNTISNNLAVGMFKEMRSKSAQDQQLPASFFFTDSQNFVTGNVAAGSDRLGFSLPGMPCTGTVALTRGSFLNNTVHSSVTGVWLKSSTQSVGAFCTELANLTSYLTWDFGIITHTGIQTSVRITDVNVIDAKHVRACTPPPTNLTCDLILFSQAGVLILKKGQMTDPAEVNFTRGVFIGASSPDVCNVSILQPLLPRVYV